MFAPWWTALKVIRIVYSVGLILMITQDRGNAGGLALLMLESEVKSFLHLSDHAL